MAPIRRYLRISKYSVLECRIFLSDPADEAWLGSRFEAPPGTDDDQRSVAARVSAPRTMLQRIFETIRPLVVSKLQEESVRRYGPGNAKKKAAPVKDVLVDDDFEASIFLRENGTFHSLLRRDKTLLSAPQDDESASQVQVRNEEDNDDVVTLQSIPAFRRDSDAPAEPRRSGRKRRKRSPSPGEGGGDDAIEEEHDQDDAQLQEKRMSSKRLRMARQREDMNEPKPTFNASYNGFRIGGWTLCLLVTRRHRSRQPRDSASGQALMEEWISSQVPQDIEDD